MNNKKNDSQSKFVIVKESYSQNLISTIINAAKNKNLITIHYYSNEKGITERDIEPMDVVIRNGKKNLVGWCRLREDWRTFRLDRVNFIKIHLGETFPKREGYNRADYQDEGVSFNVNETVRTPVSTGRPNKEFAFNTDNIKTMSENKLNFSNDEVKTYSDDEEDMAL
ncbi:MAG: helix-turn-helix transcriptional regulator [Chitinophagales bacterium]|jgi:predicted DNA-binding transcriptional regulator YafY|nr:WYL domain-containing protein [Sphingobacteriales bacterium]